MIGKDFNSRNADLFLQIKAPREGQLKIKGSRFLTTIRMITSEEEAKQVIDEVSKKYHDATHNCYAWKVGTGKKMRYRYSDDGEPNNTAGLPIFKSINARNLSNIVVIVTRYFGGIKLGTGGLIRAYSKAATDVLKDCEITKNYLTETVMFKTSFEFVSLIHNTISTFKATLKDSTFEEEVVFKIEIRASKLKEFIIKLKDGTNGQVKFLK